MGSVMGSEEWRGKIRNKELARQINDFSGLRYGKITPTDIDAFVEFKDRLFVFIEVKWANTPIPVGQRLALERSANAIRQSGRPCYVLWARHEQSSPDEDVNVATCHVSQVYKQAGWESISHLSLTVRDVIDKLRDFHGISE